jgi:DNA-binding NarL/FixJ family response regulator
MSASEKITLVVIDDHPLFRQGVVDVFAREKDIDVLGEAADGKAGLAMINELQPEVAVVDVNLPEMNGQHLTRQLASSKSQTRVLLLTAYNDSSQAIHSISAGARAYCSKDVAPEKLVDAIRAVSSGKYFVEEQEMDKPDMEKWVAQKTESIPKAYSDPGDPYEALSNREMEVLECVTRGMSNKEIAHELGISHQTVKNHVTAVLRKLNVEDRTQAAVYALRQGWVRLYDQESDDS